MLEKVKVGHEEFKALDNIMEELVPAFRHEGSSAEFTIFKFRQDGGDFIGEREAANNLTLDELFIALTVGYEEKPNPAEEVVADIIKRAEKDYFCVNMFSSEDEDKAYCKGIIRGIDLLKEKGIKFNLNTPEN